MTQRVVFKKFFVSSILLKAISLDNTPEGTRSLKTTVNQLLLQYFDDSVSKKVCLLTLQVIPVSYTHLTLPTIPFECRSRWSPYQ